ncbi:MAG: protein BatD [Deltaproteobacteria bacterium]|nr:protein BatD [Deltaproteobacteria bacterium]
MLGYKIIILILLVTLIHSTTAAAASINAQLDRSEYTIEDEILLTVTIEGSSTSKPQIPKLDAFSVSASGQSSQYQIINGRTSSSVIYNYTLIPKRKGTFTIANISATIDGKKYQAPAIKVLITNTSKDSQQNGQPAFITTTISNPKPYVGEQIVYTFRFYRRVPIYDAKLQLPDFEQLSPESLGDGIERQEQYQGHMYKVTEIKKALFAPQAGDYTIAAAALNIEIPDNRNRRRTGPFDDFDSTFSFGGGLLNRTRTRAKTLRSAPIYLHARVLPKPPPNFSGLVGSFSIQTELSKSELKVGDSTTFKISVVGKGNVRHMSEPKIPELENFKVYDDKPDTKIQIENDNVTGQTNFRKALVPIKAGDYTIPSVSVSYFNSSENKYITISSQPLVVKVLPGTTNETLHVVGEAMPFSVSKQAIEIIADDILPIHSRSALWTKPERKFCYRLAVVAAIIPPLFFITIMLLGLHKEKLQRDPSLQRRRLAKRNARAILKTVRILNNTNDTKSINAMLERAIKTYICDKLNISGGALTADEIKTRMLEKNISIETINHTYNQIIAFETSTYSNQQLDPSDYTERINSCEKLLTKLEQNI